MTALPAAAQATQSRQKIERQTLQDPSKRQQKQANLYEKEGDREASKSQDEKHLLNA